MTRPQSHPKPARVVLSAALSATLAERAQAGLPDEACGLLLGPSVFREGLAVVDELAASPNLAAEAGHKRFEIDPALHLRLRRELRGTGRAVLGLYHSHPNGSAEASQADHMGGRLEPGMIWLIVPVRDGTALHPAAYWSTNKGLVPLPLDCGGNDQQGGNQQ